jgi:hypothetical protein
MGKDKAHQYRAEIVMRGALQFDTQYVKEPFIDERISGLKLETKQHGEGPAICAIFLLIASRNRDKALVLLESLSQTIVGYLSMIFEEELELESLYLVDPKDKTMIQQQEGRWMKGLRKAQAIDVYPQFDKKERLALYWIGKGNTNVRPDDKLACYYSAAEALIPSEIKKANAKATCECCSRPFPSEAMKTFLVEQCKVDKGVAAKIVNYRGDIVHGKKSGITHYSEFILAASETLRGVQYWFAQNHDAPHYPAQMMVGGKFKVHGTANIPDDITNY